MGMTDSVVIIGAPKRDDVISCQTYDLGRTSEDWTIERRASAMWLLKDGEVDQRSALLNLFDIAAESDIIAEIEAGKVVALNRISPSLHAMRAAVAFDDSGNPGDVPLPTIRSILPRDLR